MKIRSLLIGMVSLIIFVGTVYSQKEKPKTYNIIEVKSDSVYDKTIEYLQSKDYFILSLDRLSGFIQAKTYTPDKKIFSEKMGDRRIFNFIIKANPNNTSKISLVIFLERSLRQSVDGGWTYYDRDIGIIEDDKIYIQVLEDLQKHLDHKHLENYSGNE